MRLQNTRRQLTHHVQYTLRRHESVTNVQDKISTKASIISNISVTESVKRPENCALNEKIALQNVSDGGKGALAAGRY
jgi:hypothetical protein